MREKLIVIAIVALLYVSVSQITFRFRHPWMTETELLLHLPQALTWKRAPKP